MQNLQNSASQTWNEVMYNAMEKVMSEPSVFNNEVKAAGGRLFVTHLIPCPKLLYP